MNSPLVDVMIVGAEKAGTTSVLRYLGEHPGVQTHGALEMPYFVDDGLHERGWEPAFREYFEPVVPPRLIVAKSVGCMYWPTAAARLKQHNPRMKLVAVLRDPVERAYSAYRYAVQMRREELGSFEEAVDAEAHRLQSGGDFHARYHAYLHRGLYAGQVARLFEQFPRRQIEIVVFEELRADAARVIAELSRNLGLSPHAPDTSVVHNEPGGRRGVIRAWLGSRHSGAALWIARRVPVAVRRLLVRQPSPEPRSGERPSPVAESTRSRLRGYFASDVATLERLIGRDLSAWWR